MVAGCADSGRPIALRDAGRFLCIRRSETDRMLRSQTENYLLMMGRYLHLLIPSGVYAELRAAGNSREGSPKELGVHVHFPEYLSVYKPVYARRPDGAGVRECSSHRPSKAGLESRTRCHRRAQTLERGSRGVRMRIDRTGRCRTLPGAPVRPGGCRSEGKTGRDVPIGTTSA